MQRYIIGSRKRRVARISFRFVSHIYGVYPWPTMNALAGNRTSVSHVAGENSTTEPPMEAKVDWSVSDRGGNYLN